MRLVKNLKKVVSDETYNIAYANVDNQKIISSVLSKYRGKLEEETLKTCGLNALWRCLQSHQESYTTKFTSSLWRFVHWECKKELQILARNKFRPVELTDIPIEMESANIFEDINVFLDKEHCDIVKLRFLHGMTLKEIGQTFGFSKEAARQKLDKALKQIKRVVYNVGEG